MTSGRDDCVTRMSKNDDMKVKLMSFIIFSNFTILAIYYYCSYKKPPENS